MKIHPAEWNRIVKPTTTVPPKVAYSQPATMVFVHT